jgi:GTP-binding protein
MEAWPAFRDARVADGMQVLATSAATGDGITSLRDRIAETLPSAEELSARPEPAGIVVHRFESAGDTFQVTAEDGAFRVIGRRIERLAAQTNFENEESATRFQRDLARMGIDEQLRRAGVGAGDAVRIGGVELEWEPELWESE